MKISTTLILIGALIVILSPSCQNKAPITKKQYLENFKNFTQEITNKCLCTKPKKIENLDENYLKFSQDWYELYYNELSNEEVRTVWKYRAVYLGCKISLDARNSTKELLQKLERSLSQSS